MADRHHLLTSRDIDAAHAGSWRRWTTTLTLLSFVLAGITAAAAPTQGEFSQPLSLDRAIGLALERNPDVKSTENALQAAEAARRAAVGKLYPQIKALSWYELFPTKRARLIPRAFFEGVTDQADVFQDRVFNIGLGLDWTLYAGGRLWAGVAGARAQTEAAGDRLERVRQRLAFAVTQTYLGVGVAERSEQAVQASIQHLTEAQANLQEFVKVGKKPRLDLLRVQARLDQTRQLLADVQAALVTVRGNLRRLLDLDPSGPPLALADDDDAQEAMPPLQPIAVALEQALANRPDYRALQAEAEAQRAQLRIAQGARLPEVDLTARAWEAHGNRTGGPINDFEADSQIVLSASVPLFTGGTLLAEVHRARAQVNQINERLASLRQQIRQDVVQAYADLRAAHARVLAAKAGVRSADEAFRDQREKTAVGAGTVTDLLDTQAADLSAQTALYQAQADVGVASAGVELAIGVLGRPPAGTDSGARAPSSP